MSYSFFIAATILHSARLVLSFLSFYIGPYEFCALIVPTTFFSVEFSCVIIYGQAMITLYANAVRNIIIYLVKVIYYSNHLQPVAIVVTQGPVTVNNKYVRIF